MDAAALWRDVVEELETQGIKARVVPVERLAEVAAPRRRGDRRRRVPGGRSPRSSPTTSSARCLWQAGAGGAAPGALGRHRRRRPSAHAGEPDLARRDAHRRRPAALRRLRGRPPGDGREGRRAAAPAGFARAPLRAAAQDPRHVCPAWPATAATTSPTSPASAAGCSSAPASSDAPPPDDAEWGEPAGAASAASAAAPACAPVRREAIGGDRFVLHTERCLTLHNESRDPLPDWLDAVGPSHRRRLPALPAGVSRERRRRPRAGGAGVVRRARRRRRSSPPSSSSAQAPTTRCGGGRSAAKREWPGLAETTREKLARCGLDYSPKVIARNIRVLLEGQPRRNG